MRPPEERVLAALPGVFAALHRFLIGVCGFLAGVYLVLACTPGEKQAAKTVLDVADAVCAEVEKGSDNEYVSLVCTAIGAADGASHVFLMRVPRADAPRFARPCPAGAK